MAIFEGIGYEPDHAKIAEFLDGEKIVGAKYVDDDLTSSRRWGDLILILEDGREAHIQTCGCCGGIALEVKRDGASS